MQLMLHIDDRSFLSLLTCSTLSTQFETSSLEAVLYMLDMFTGIDSDGRRDPVKVTRALVEMVGHLYSPAN